MGDNGSIQREAKESDDDSEEFSVNLSKIKGFFGRLKGRVSSQKVGHEASPKEYMKHSQIGEDGEPEKDLETERDKEHHKGKGHERDEDHDGDGEDEQSISLNPQLAAKVKKALFKYWPYLLIIIPILITVNVREQTLNLTIADDWARNAVYDYYRNQITGQVRQQYPNLPDQNIQGIVNDEFQKFVNSNQALVRDQMRGTAQNFKEYFQYESGSKKYAYMGDIDSYYWLRAARNLEQKGTICDLIEDGNCIDTYTLAPAKEGMYPNLHPYAIFYLYKALKPFNKDLTLMQAELLVPTFFAIIVAILTFIMMFEAFGPLAALISSVLISVSPMFLTRSLGSDTDVYNVLFPVIAVFFIFEAFHAKSLKPRIIHSSLAGIFLGFYSFAWVGWWYLFDFAILALVIDFAIKLFKHGHKAKDFSIRGLRKFPHTKEFLSILLPLAVFTLITVGAVTDIGNITTFYKEPFAFMKAKSAANPSLWPNVKTTVAEFNESSVETIVSSMGGIWPFFFASTGFLILLFYRFRNFSRDFFFFFVTLIALYLGYKWAPAYYLLLAVIPLTYYFTNRSWPPTVFVISTALLYYLSTPTGTNLRPSSYLFIYALPFLAGTILSIRSEDEHDQKLSFLFFLWVAASIFASLKGVRFILLMVPPLAIGAGITFGYMSSVLSRLAAKPLKIKKAVISAILFLVFSYYLVGPVGAGISVAKNYLPSVNDQWWDVLTKIKDNSQPNAIINSWWDFGHWFKYIADRGVTLDGSSQNAPPLHWLGKTLLTPDENEARGILRMLSCGSNNAFHGVNAQGNFTPKAVDALHTITAIKGKEDAAKALQKLGYEEENIRAALTYSHCDAPEDFFITSQDMVGKGGVWAHFGSWDFNRAFLERTFRESGSEPEFAMKVKEHYNYTDEFIQSSYRQLSSLKSDQAINQWISPWPSYLGGPSRCRNESSKATCRFQNVDVTVNLSRMDASIQTPQGTKYVDVLSWTTPDSVVSKNFTGDTIGVGMVLLIEKSGYNAVFMTPQLVNSTFTKLFYLDGHGTRFFDLFSDTQGMNGFSIKAWKLNWEGRNESIKVDRFNVTNRYFGKNQP
ncbi:hypothetical protein HYU14_01560 [Candidatus Woesearchaeota archaeon]|nr:hypothetical protein [Candidatus Woesearchaeota archaeon]